MRFNQPMGRGKRNGDMQRIDAGYLYELGAAVRALRPYRLSEVTPVEIWGALEHARTSVSEFLHNSVYSTSMRAVYIPSRKFLEAMDALRTKIVEDRPDKITQMDMYDLFAAFDRFEPVLSSELSSIATFLVQPKGAYDIAVLVDAGERMFPQSIHLKSPDAVADLQEGAKSLAFELWTASAFHFHRANEAVLRRYYDLVMEGQERPKNSTMGTLLAAMKKADKGDKDIIAALDNIKTFHRNPISHPDHKIDNADEAMSLVAAIRAAIGYMLDRLPNIDFNDLMTTDFGYSQQDGSLFETPAAG